MGIYYTNALYYGRIMREETYKKCITKLNMRSKNDFCIKKVGYERYIIYSKMVYVDDGVESSRSVPDYISSKKLIELNDQVDESFFREELKEKFENLLKTFSPNDYLVNFFVCCIESCTLDDGENTVLYNLRVRRDDTVISI